MAVSRSSGAQASKTRGWNTAFRGQRSRNDSAVAKKSGRRSVLQSGELHQVCVLELEPGVHYDVRLQPTYLEDGNLQAVIGIGIDVSQRVSDEFHRQTIEKQLFQSKKLESLGLLAGGIAHDFNNYLTAIVSFCETILADRKCPSDFQPTVEQILQTALQAAGVTQQMLLFAGRTKDLDIAVNKLDLNDLLNRMIPFLRAVVPRSIRFDVRTGESAVWINGCESELQRLILNVVKNAADAAIEVNDSEVSVRVAEFQADSCSSFSIGELDEGLDYVMLEVSDNGSGIAPEHLEKICDPYFTTRDDGHGFGMAIATRVMVDHHGAIHVNDVEPHGTRIRLLFPLVEVRPAEIRRKSGLNSHARTNRTILLVDDEAVVRKSIGMVLESRGNRVISAGDAEAAMEEMQTNQDKIDCLILDYSMPSVNGLQLLNQIRSSGWRQPAILCSGFVMEVTDYPDAKFWPEEILEKPFKLDVLQQAMDKLCSPSS